jgi:hypothetical protein
MLPAAKKKLCETYTQNAFKPCIPWLGGGFEKCTQNAIMPNQNKIKACNGLLK